MEDKQPRIVFITNSALVERPEGLFSPFTLVRRQILAPALALESAGVGVHVISLADWPREQILPILEKADRIVFGAATQQQDYAAYARLERDCGSRRRVVLFLSGTGEEHALAGQYSSTSLAWIVASEAAKVRLASRAPCPILVYPMPAESIRGVPRIRRRGFRESAATWVAHRYRVALDPWRFRLLWFGDAAQAAALQNLLPELEALASRMPLLVECLIEPGSVLDFDSTKPETAASASLRIAINDRSPQTLTQALDECDAVILPTRDEKALGEPNDRAVDALHAGRFVIAQPLPSYEPLQDFLWMGSSVAGGIAWLHGHPREALRRLQRGQRYVSRHHNKAALLRFWLQLLDFGSTVDASALIERGRQQYALGKLSAARQLLLEALAIDRAAPDLRRLLGHVYRDAGKLDHAITSYRRAIRLDPDFAAAYDDLGLAYASKGWPEDAIQCHRQALEIDPNNPATHLKLASALRSIGRHSEASKHRRLAMSLQVRNHARQLLSRFSGTR